MRWRSAGMGYFCLVVGLCAVALAAVSTFAAETATNASQNEYAPSIVVLEPHNRVFTYNHENGVVHLKVAIDDADDAGTHLETDFDVWACIAWDLPCVPGVNISATRTKNATSGETTYSWDFDVTNASVYPAGEYQVCARASDHILVSADVCVEVALLPNIGPGPPPRIASNHSAPPPPPAEPAATISGPPIALLGVAAVSAMVLGAVAILLQRRRAL